MIPKVNQGIASIKDVSEFREALDKMNLSLIQFCEMVAVEEGGDDSKEEDKIRNNVKRYLNREMKKERLLKYWGYLSQHSKFSKVDRVVLPSSSEYLKRSDYSADIISSFED